MGNTLIVDFQGPIAFRFNSYSAYAYIPDCDYHTGNLLTDTDDIPLDKHDSYTLAGPAGSQKTKVKGKALIALLNWSQTSGNPKNTDCYSIFQMPLPDCIYGLRPEWVSITTANNAPVMSGKYARGLRFCYSNVPSSPTITGLSKPLTFDAASSQNSSSTDIIYRIEIRFRDYAAYDPTAPKYDDAMKCSKKMRGLFPPLDQWIVSFDPPAPTAVQVVRVNAEGIMLSPGPHGSDCGANGFVFDDGGLELP